MCMYYPRRWELAWRFHVLMGSFQLSSVPQRQLSASARHSAVSGTQSWRHGSGCSILHWQIYTIVRPRDGKCVRAREHSTFPRRLSLPGLTVMTFQRLSSRRIQSSQPSQTFACPAWDGRVFAGFCKSSSTLAHGVTQLHKPRFTAVTCVILAVNGETLQKRRPKASTDDRPRTRKLLFSFLFNSRALIATLRHIASTTRTAMPCAPRSYQAFGDRDRWPGPRPTRPPPLHLHFSSNFTIVISLRVAQKNVCQTHSLSMIHLSGNKPRWEKAKKKKSGRLSNPNTCYRVVRVLRRTG